MVRLNIIHIQQRADRLRLLMRELEQENITEYNLWNGILHANPKKGIAKAHKQIIEWAREEQLPSVLIAEDDIKFTAPGAFEYFIKNEPAAYDLYLGGIIYGKLNPDNSVNDFSGTHLYKIHRRFYDTFLAMPEDKDIDRSLANKGRFIVCNPFAAIQHNGHSDNQKKYHDYGSYLQGRKLFNCPHSTPQIPK